MKNPLNPSWTSSGPNQNVLAGSGPFPFEVVLLGQHKPYPCFGLMLAQLFWADFDPISFWDDPGPTRVGLGHIIGSDPTQYIIIIIYNIILYIK